MSDKFCLLFTLITLVTHTSGRIHNLEITNDVRKYISLSTFGFFKGGILEVHLENFKTSPHNEDMIFGFSLDRTQNDGMNPYREAHQDTCVLLQDFHTDHDTAVIYFNMDLKNKILHINCSAQWEQPINIYRNFEDIPTELFRVKSHRQQMYSRLSRDSKISNKNTCNIKLPILVSKRNNISYYNTSFVLFVGSESEAGLYNLYFHCCPNYQTEESVSYDFKMEIKEDNHGNYLSAGEMQLPALYCTMAVLFFLSGCFWVFILRQSKHPVFKIHYLMAALVFLKALSLAFHGVNYHYIERLGVHIATWAVLFYVAHLLKGALLFVTLILIGTGWTFIKHVLAPRDKKLFMAIIPLQVLANVAEIILEESEEGAAEHHAWRDIFIFVDLICCGCISFPVVWSIRHLQEASTVDDKAAMNLRKLKLFRHFYIMIICYIYFTRIIVYLLKITVPFQYGWLDEMFKEMSTYVFFVLTGYKFRPASQNPYFSVPDDDDDEDKDYAITESGITEGLSKVTSRLKNNFKKSTTTMTEIMEEEEKENLLPQKESSHEYD